MRPTTTLSPIASLQRAQEEWQTLRKFREEEKEEQERRMAERRRRLEEQRKEQALQVRPYISPYRSHYLAPI